MSTTKNNSNNINDNECDLAHKDLYSWKKRTIIEKHLPSPPYSSLLSTTTRSPLSTYKGIILKPISAISKVQQQSSFMRDKFEETLIKEVNNLKNVDNRNFDALLNDCETDLINSKRVEEKADMVSFF